MDITKLVVFNVGKAVISQWRLEPTEAGHVAAILNVDISIFTGDWFDLNKEIYQNFRFT